MFELLKFVSITENFEIQSFFGIIGFVSKDIFNVQGRRDQGFEISQHLCEKKLALVHETKRALSDKSRGFKRPLPINYPIWKSNIQDVKQTD